MEETSGRFIVESYKTGRQVRAQENIYRRMSFSCHLCFYSFCTRVRSSSRLCVCICLSILSFAVLSLFGSRSASCLSSRLVSPRSPLLWSQAQIFGPYLTTTGSPQTSVSSLFRFVSCLHWTRVQPLFCEVVLFVHSRSTPWGPPSSTFGRPSSVADVPMGERSGTSTVGTKTTRQGSPPKY